MSIVRATWQDGQVHLDSPASWPEGRRLVVVEDRGSDIEFMTEEEQSDDPASIEQWIAELRALPALTMTPNDEANLDAWRKKVKEFNLSAVRRQMEEGFP